MKKLIFINIVIVLFNYHFANAQDVSLSQFYNCEVFVNPAFSGGNNGKFRFAALNRRQWANVAVPYSSTLFVADKSIMTTNKMNLSAAAIILSDNSGNSRFKTFQASLNISAGVKTGAYSFVATGIQLGYRQNSLNLNGLSWDAQYNGRNYDPSLNSLENISSTNFSGINSAFGMAYTYTPTKNKYFKFGISGFNLLKFNNSFTQNENQKLDRRYTLFAAGEFTESTNNISYLPSMLIQLQGPSYNIATGILFGYRLGVDSKITNRNKSSVFLWGIHYRFADAVIPSVHFKFKRQWSAGLSYDINFSKLTPASQARGGFELCLNYFVGNK